MKYCCNMREYFVIGIIGKRSDIEAPTDMADFIVAWEPKIIVRIKYCPFCGKEVTDDQVVRIQT